MSRLKVNINGSSFQSLWAKAEYAHRSVKGLRDNLANMTPHGRDYQTCDDPQLAFELDRDEHAHMMKITRQLEDYLMRYMVNLDKQR